MATEETRQSAKEQAVLLALRNGMALIRRDLEIHGMAVDGRTHYICTGASYDSLWQDALRALERKFGPLKK